MTIQSASQVAIEPPTFALGGLHFGLMTCYDLRFPEVSRTLVDVGADVFLVPAEWVRGPLKEHHWRTLLHASQQESDSHTGGRSIDQYRTQRRQFDAQATWKPTMSMATRPMR